jgi:hypothetical protein
LRLYGQIQEADLPAVAGDRTVDEDEAMRRISPLLALAGALASALAVRAAATAIFRMAAGVLLLLAAPIGASEETKLLAADPATGRSLGFSVAIDGDLGQATTPLLNPVATGPKKLRNVGSLTAKLCPDCPYEQWCSGTLIGKQAFATAAHCIITGYQYGAIGFGVSFVDEFPVDPNNPFSFPLPEGAVNYTGTPVFHPDYTLAEFFNEPDPDTVSDIAVVVLDEPVHVPVPSLPQVGALDRIAAFYSWIGRKPMLGMGSYGMTENGTWDVPDWGTRRLGYGALLRRFGSAAEFGAPIHQGDSGAPVFFTLTTRYTPIYIWSVVGMLYSGFNDYETELGAETGIFIRFDVPRIRDFLVPYAEMGELPPLVGDIPMCKITERGVERTMLVPSSRVESSLDKGLSLGDCESPSNGRVLCKVTRGTRTNVLLPDSKVSTALDKGLAFGACSTPTE